MQDPDKDPSDQDPDDDDNDDLPDDWADQLMANMNGIPGMDSSAMAAQMRQFLDADGNIDMNKLMGGLRSALGQAMAGSDPASGMNWKNTTTAITRLVAAQGKDPQPEPPTSEMLDAFSLASLWLDQATVFDGSAMRLELWNRERWVKETMGAWQSIAAPIASRLGDALIDLITENLSGEGNPIAGLSGMTDMLAPMMRSTAGEFYSARLSRAIADLAAATLSGTDTALPVVQPPAIALLPRNIEEFTAGLVAPPTDTSVFLLMREIARQRLFNATPWLGPQLLALIEHYAREITIDPNTLREGFDVDQLDQLVPERLAEMSAQMEDRLFRPASTPEQQAILSRLEVLISLVEGWVETVVSQAAAPWLASQAALTETMQRRRAAGGPAEQALKALLGLDLGSRRVREAANLWAAIGHDRGIEQRDAIWHHPDMLPQAEDLDDVLGYVAKTSADAAPDAMDTQLNWLVDQWRKDSEA